MNSETVDAAVQTLWRTVNEQMDEKPTSETPHPSVLQVVLEADLAKLKPAETGKQDLCP